MRTAIDVTNHGLKDALRLRLIHPANYKLNTIAKICTVAGVAFQSALQISIPAIVMVLLMIYTLTDSEYSNSDFFVNP